MSLFGYVLAAMLAMLPTRSAARFEEYEEIALAIVEATSDADDALDLVAFGRMEGSFVRRACGKLGEVGVWQLMPPQPCAIEDVGCQAKEALRRLREQGACGYAGEDWRGDCPKGRRRRNLATVYRALHPWPTVADPGRS